MIREPFEELCLKHHPMNSWELCNFTYRSARRLKRRTLGFCGTSSTKSLEKMTEILDKMGFLKEVEGDKKEAAKSIILNYITNSQIKYKEGFTFLGAREEKYLLITTDDEGKNYQISSYINPFLSSLLSS